MVFLLRKQIQHSASEALPCVCKAGKQTLVLSAQLGLSMCLFVGHMVGSLYMRGRSMAETKAASCS